MSLLARPSVVFAIVFGCFAVLLPRVFVPIFRSKPSIIPSTNNVDERLRRPPSGMGRGEPGDNIEHIPGTPPHLRGAHPHMRMHHPGFQAQQQASAEHGSSKSIVTLALPMYTVGIGVFFIYTCCKYWSKKDSNENKRKNRHLENNIQWNGEKRKRLYDILEKDSQDEDNKDELYGDLDPDYIEYLKSKKQKALEAEKMMTDEQKQLHKALEEMKKSLSFISSKLITTENRDNLNGDEITQLQARLAATESQMCKILTALDAASDKVNTLTSNSIKAPKTDDESCSVSKSSTSEEESNADQGQSSSSSSDGDDDDENVPNQMDEEYDNESNEHDHLLPTN